MGRGGESFRVRVAQAKTAVDETVKPGNPKQRLYGCAAVESLNKEVDRKTAAAVALSNASGSALSVTFRASSRPMSAGGLWSGAPIYHTRPLSPTIVMAIVAAYLVVTGAAAVGWPTTVVSFGLVFLLYDLFSGVLHVVLDEPKNINLPIIGQPALEFQWHHLIPSDIARKDFSDVVGDLGLVIPALMAINMVTAADYGNDSLAKMLLGMKVYMAYFGQFSHRSAHDIKLGYVPQLLQKMGVMISIRDHKSHHTAPHDQDFCLIGVCNPIVQKLYEATNNRFVWLAMFLFFCTLDVKLLAMGIRVVMPELP